jgi:hypothetical protein
MLRHPIRLLAVYCAGTRQKEFLGSMRRGKLESTLCTGNNGRKHLKRRFLGLPRSRLGCRMDDIPVFSAGEHEIANVADVEFHRRIGCQMRALFGKSLWTASE